MMKTGKQRILAGVLAMALVAAGCTSTPESAPQSPAPSPAQPAADTARAQQADAARKARETEPAQAVRAQPAPLSPARPIPAPSMAPPVPAAAAAPSAAPMAPAPPSPSRPAPYALSARPYLAPPAALPPHVARQDTAKYHSFADNPWRRVGEEPVSTFSADVDTGSYANVRRFINRGHLPPKDAVRVEELVNYFGYDYPLPAASQEHPFGVQTTVVRSPWNAERSLLRIAIRGRDAAKATLPPANLVFLVDVSGSMAPADRLPLVQSALKLLASQLRPQDRVTLVTYANGTRLALPPTAGDRKDAIHAAIDQLVAGGGTYGEAGIRMAYTQAREARIPGGINRVLLATDGDLNIGMTSPAALKALVEDERKQGIGLTTLGVGGSNYNELLMKQLADAGDGSYHYLDSLQEAYKVLVNEMTSTLAVIAQDLKLQVEFNPANVDEYRLVGYELRALSREQFNDDKVDAGDIGAGHTVTALYELVPHGARGSVDPLRYGKPKASAPSQQVHAAELGWLKLRYKRPGETTSRLVQVPIRKVEPVPDLEGADADLRFAVAVAGWGQWLRGSTLVGGWTANQSLALARGARGEDRYGHRAEFLRLVGLSASLAH